MINYISNNKYLKTIYLLYLYNMAAKRQRKSKKTTQPATTQELSVEPVSTPTQPEPVQQTPVVEVTTNTEVKQEPVEEVDEMTQLIGKMHEQFSQLNTLYREMAANMKTLDKLHQKERKRNSKSSRRRAVNPNRKPSGFAKPSLLSDELCKFVGKPKGSLMARTEVTKFITGYIKDHNLQDPEFKRRILPDNKLNKLLKVPKSQELTYFNLQTYMKTHFPKPVESSS